MTELSTKHVIFGTGAVGRAVMEALLRRNAQVVMVNRGGKMVEKPAEVELVAADANNADTVRTLTADAAVVYQCAQPPYNKWAEAFPPLQAAIIEGVSANGARLVLAENLYMYGEVDGPIHEGLPYRAHTKKGRVRAEMAEAAFAAHEAGRLPVTAGRASDFYGPWATDSTMGERVFYPALNGKAAQIIGNPEMPHTHTYIGDYGEALVLLGEREEAQGRAWHVPNDQPSLTQREFVNLIFAELGKEPKISAMGKLMMRIGGLFIPEARESVEMMYEFEKPFVVDSSAFENTFGMRPTPVREALRPTVAWYRAHPQGEH